MMTLHTPTGDPIKVDQRYELSPAHDRWMMGDRTVTVVYVGRKRVNVAGERSGQVFSVHPDYIHKYLNT